MGGCTSSTGDMSPVPADMLGGPAEPEEALTPRSRRKANALMRFWRWGSRGSRNTHNVSLIGPSGAGKSAFAATAVACFTPGLPKEDRQRFVPVIQQTFGRLVLSLALAMIRHKIEMDPENADFVNEFHSEWTTNEQCIIDNPVFKRRVLIFWNSKETQAAYAMRDAFGVTDELAYYMTRLDDVLTAGFIPNDLDISWCRTPTSGMMEYRFKVGRDRFVVSDFGGHPSERRKWIHAYEKDVVFYMAAAGDYPCISPFTSESALLEGLNVWESFVNQEAVERTPIFLIFNKEDTFKSKLEKVHLSKVFPDYAGGDDYAFAAEFVKEKFLDRVKGDRSRISVHFVSAVDMDSVRNTLCTVRDVLVSGVLGGKPLLKD